WLIEEFEAVANRFQGVNLFVQVLHLDREDSTYVKGHAASARELEVVRNLRACEQAFKQMSRVVHPFVASWIEVRAWFAGWCLPCLYPRFDLLLRVVSCAG